MTTQTAKRPPLARPTIEEGPAGSAMVRVPFPLRDRFKADFPFASWNLYAKCWVVPARGAAYAHRWVAERQGPPRGPN
jgi:hypothetical protein